MNIVIVGQGAIGLLWYHQLSQQKQNNTSLLCSKRITKAPSHYRFTSIQQQTNDFPLQIANNEHLASADIILFCVKSYQLQSAIAHISQIKNQALFIFSHNGMGAYPIDSINNQPCLALLTTHGCKKIAPFHIQHTGKGNSDIGLISGQYPTEKLTTITEVFALALPQVSYSLDIKEKQWLKLAINCVINPLTAINNIENGDVLKAEFQEQIKNVINELVEVAKHENVELCRDELIKTVTLVAQNTAKNSSSMRSDILNKQQTEIDYINGYVIKLAVTHGLSAPENTALVKQVKQLTCASHD